MLHSMNEFLLLFAKIFPLYLIVAAGYLAGKKLKVDKDTIATIAIYIVTPVVIFNGVATAPSSNKYLLLPVIFFLVACMLGGAFYKLGGLLWHNGEKNILGFTAGTGNTGYFGLPLILAVLGTPAQSIAILSILGFVLYESTVGYYFIAKGDATAKDTIIKVLKLPLIYAFVLGVIANKLGYNPATPITDLVTNFRGAYIVLGMLIIGIGLASVTRAALDTKFTLVTFLAKFICYPAIVALLILLDQTTLKLFNADTYKVMLLLSIVPLASNTVAFATKLKVHPEKAAFTVLLSTIFALFFIPLFVAVFFK
jgi:malate permease and related proteins